MMSGKTKQFTCLALALFCCNLMPAARHASFIFDAGSDEVLHEVNATALRYPASLTKMMTLYLLFSALDKSRLNFATNLPVSTKAAGQPPSKIGLAPGDRITVLDAILSLVVKSANDIAVVVAEALAGSESAFAEQMNQQAKKLGMNNTTFRNASGLPDRQQQTTARDMARLAHALWRDFPEYYHFFSITSFNYKGREHENHNKLLNDFPGLDGIKTGYIRMSGFNLAASAEQDGRRLFAVVMGGKSPEDRNYLMADLLKNSFSEQHIQPEFKVRSLWTLQVGAFRNIGNARDFLETISSKLGLEENKRKIVPLESRKGLLYRARLTGFAEQEAHLIKNRLKQMNIECFLIPPSGNPASTTGFPGTAN